MSMIPREKLKPHGEDVCLHIYNHCTEGVLKDYPLGEDDEKRKMVSLLHYYLQKTTFLHKSPINNRRARRIDWAIKIEKNLFLKTAVRFQ